MAQLLAHLLLLFLLEQAQGRPQPSPCLELKLAHPTTQDVDLLPPYWNHTSKLESKHLSYLVIGVDVQSLKQKVQHLDKKDLCTGSGYSSGPLRDAATGQYLLKELGLPLNATAPSHGESTSILCIQDENNSVSLKLRNVCV